MRTLSAFYFTTVGLQLNILILFVSTLLACGLYFYSNFGRQRTTTYFNYPVVLSNSFLTLSLVSSGLLFLISFYFYLTTYINLAYGALINPLLLFKGLTFYHFYELTFAINLYGYIIIFLALFVGFFALLVSENKIKSQNLNFLFYFNYFLLVVYLFVSINDVIGLFICYELLLLPSFFFVYFISYTRKALQACLYFVI